MAISMRVAFRTDGSPQIGTGHVMRCLTLADALREEGAECEFVSREHDGHLMEYIRSRGYPLHALPRSHVREPLESDLAHSHWLGVDWQTDAAQTRQVLASKVLDWLIVDHYALDAQWECALASIYRQLMVIDDLADRPHASDLLLDQTFGRDAADYRPLVPTECRLLCGCQFALLRPEFAALRPYSLQRRTQPALRELLITMGGVDKDNATGQVLQALLACRLPAECRLTVVMGVTAPWLEEVRTQAQDMLWPTRVLVGVSDMAQLMADCDLAIGAAGATSWERCCLGLPTIMLPLAENQAHSCRTLSEVGAGLIIPEPEMLSALLPTALETFVNESVALSEITATSSSITDGRGIERVVQAIMR